MKSYLLQILLLRPLLSSGNGPTTVKYFEDKFGIKAKESLALMGGHTLGKFNTFQSHIDYSWVRELKSRRNEIFNNEYYKVLSARPALVKDGYCLGTWGKCFCLELNISLTSDNFYCCVYLELK